MEPKVPKIALSETFLTRTYNVPDGALADLYSNTFIELIALAGQLLFPARHGKVARMGQGLCRGEIWLRHGRQAGIPGI